MTKGIYSKGCRKLDRRKNNRVGRIGYKIDNEVIVSMYLDDELTMKEIGDKLGISHWTVLDRLKKSGVRKTTRHKVNHNVFSDPNPSNCYWAGFLAADGCIAGSQSRVEVELQHRDKDHLERLCSFASRDKKLWFRNRQRDGKVFKYVSVSLGSKKIVTDLANNFSVVPKKSLILAAPNIPSYLNNHFIRGYIDGDGCVGWHKSNDCPRLGLISGSKDIIKWIDAAIHASVPNIGSPSVISHENSHTIEYMGEQVYNILDWVYNDSTVNTRLQRKYERYKEYLQVRMM